MPAPREFGSMKRSADARVKTVITYGTFDLFHIGHLNLLKKLDGMAERVVVAVSTDEFNERKGKRSLVPYEQRAAIVEAIQYVDLVIPEHSWEQKERDIEKYCVDRFVIGKDWEGKFDFLNDKCEVMYLDRTKDVSTTALKQSLERFLYDSTGDMTDVLERLYRDIS